VLLPTLKNIPVSCSEGGLRQDHSVYGIGMTVHERVEQIYLAERENIYGYLLYFGLPPQRAQELAQDSFLKLYLKMSRGETIDNPRAWLYRVAHNFALRSFNRERVFDELDPEFQVAVASPDPERALLERERKTALLKAIQALSPQQRNCLHLRVRGLRYREIADTLGISTSAVGEFLRRATVRLKEALGG
jgi:RNA polymerase sigma-70 factor (ECF subfamily)